MKRLLLLSTTTGYQAQEFRKAAERMGAELALASDRCHRLEDPWQDGAIPVRPEKPRESVDRILEFARENPIAGVVAIGDAPTAIAALACRELGLPYHPPEAVEACRNKFLARERYRAADLPAPWYCRYPAGDAPPEDVPFPCVLKPLGLSASRGVIRANDRAQFLAAFARIRDLLRATDVRKMKEEASDWIQVESYIPGVEMALEGMLTQGRLQTLALFDKPDPLEGPYFEETIYVTPSRLAAEAQQAIVETVTRAAEALGLWHGPLHAEVRLNDEGVWMLDMAARPIGGLCARTLRFNGGMPLEELILRHARGEPVDQLTREAGASGVMMIPIPHAGIFETVENLQQAAETPGVVDIEITAKLKQELVPLPEGYSYLGFLFARGDSPEFVERALRTAHQKLRFVISPKLPLV